MKKYAAEFLGTFGLVFIGTGAVVMREIMPGIYGQAVIALAFGLSVMAMVLCFARFSGAHINPAVTIGLAASGRFDRSLVIRYLFFQVAGALAASWLLKQLFPASIFLGATLPSVSLGAAFLLEVLLTAFLMLVILILASRGITVVAVAAGLVVGLEAFWAGPATGASMNPARSLAPALFSGHTEFLWIYLLAPTAGAAATCIIIGQMKKNKKC